MKILKRSTKKSKAKKAVAMAKGRVYDDLYARLETKEGEKELYRLARQRDRAGNDVQHVRVIKDENGNVMVNSEAVLKEYFEKLMNEENNREPRTGEAEVVNKEVNCVSREEVKNALRRMKKGKAVGPDELPVEVWKCMGEMGIKFLTRLFNRLLMGERVPEEWRSVLIPIYKNKGDTQCCGNYRGVKLMSHTMKVWERIIETRLRDRVEISKQQYGFMPARKGNHRCLVCFKNVNGKIQGRSKRATLCIHGPREGLQQGSTRRAVVLHEKIRNSGKVCATSIGYV